MVSFCFVVVAFFWFILAFDLFLVLFSFFLYIRFVILLMCFCIVCFTISCGDRVFISYLGQLCAFDYFWIFWILMCDILSCYLRLFVLGARVDPRPLEDLFVFFACSWSAREFFTWAPVVPL